MPKYKGICTYYIFFTLFTFHDLISILVMSVSNCGRVWRIYRCSEIFAGVEVLVYPTFFHNTDPGRRKHYREELESESVDVILVWLEEDFIVFTMETSPLEFVCLTRVVTVPTPPESCWYHIWLTRVVQNSDCSQIRMVESITSRLYSARGSAHNRLGHGQSSRISIFRTIRAWILLEIRPHFTNASDCLFSYVNAEDSQIQ